MTNEATDEPMHEIASPKDDIPSWNGYGDKQKALDALDELYGQALEFHSLGTTVLYETVRATLTRDNSEAIRVAKEALEAGVYALAYVEDNGKGDGITLAAEGLMREAITKLNAALGG